MATEPRSKGEERVSCIVVAAGRGARMGAPRNKLLLDLAGFPVLLHTIRNLARSGRITEFVVVVTADDRAEVTRLLEPERTRLPRITLALGGAERVDSVRNGAAAVAPDATLVLVHDGARPFVSARLIADLIEAAAAHGAAIPSLPVADTLKRVDGGIARATVDRTGLEVAQTPQAFRAELLRRALADSASRAGATDDAALLEAIGIPVHVVRGDPMNLKITTPADLALAHAILPLFDPERGNA